ncbi:hypothetical protein RO21_06110 [[Actinobacillus] muris]|uniref:Phage N-6-adenine-methyltransferase n=1 Tax=Muribacter muris TaxID=67855 RepID=A0A0J5P5E5_9PAST|nr:phage N-6-adenine-methyltransferase [Muribacter muris]KMK51486.1 hypothetical protein RO21_06110 [[Actinobacillus] muris] [Muribacter muris]
MLIGNKTQTAQVDKDCWATPWPEFRGIQILLKRQFLLDACAAPHNAKCDRFFTQAQDCLKTDWGEATTVWINPPYSNPTPFIQRAIEQSKQAGHYVAMLLPADTSTRWFQLCQQNAREIWFITGGRINFLHNRTGKAKTGNSKGSMIVVFDPLQPMNTQCYTGYIELQRLREWGTR